VAFDESRDLEFGAVQSGTTLQGYPKRVLLLKVLDDWFISHNCLKSAAAHLRLMTEGRKEDRLFSPVGRSLIYAIYVIYM
jgi:hypothetical protein